jgi:predicted NBD/HSP70 family sugar kinase
MRNLRAGSKEMMKELNKALVIHEIRAHGPVSRSEISKRLNLVQSTITKICDELIEQNMIFPIGEQQSTGGRKAISLVFNNNYGYTIAVKIEDYQILFALTNLKPLFIQTNSVCFDKHASFSEIQDLLVAGIAQMKTVAEGKGFRLLGIGIAVSGVVDQANGVLTSSSLLGWKDIHFRELLEPLFELPVQLDNDLNCYTLAQARFGHGRDNSNFICMTIGEGIGAGIVIDNQIYRGAIGGAGEFGHTIVQLNGRDCLCGQKGCLEAHASDAFIVNYVYEKTGERKRIEDILLEESAMFNEAVEIAWNYLGLGLINLIMLFNPEKIIISCHPQVGKHWKDSKMLQVVKNNWYERNGVFSTDIVFDDLNNDNFLLGASLLVMSVLFDEPIYKGQGTIYNNL